ncbi:cyclic nucleotide-binding domain-containing protein [Magnetospirillum sp. SS-4]|uniref:cyclic nucleotide-binding domain-containing protein n=1 Tax=Magnetospirillum sp. SS-4 TaxID=2681465 RepID=UPI001385A0CE|nr:cyclic nucleotide-binding domain-containing protein [Magnetospirillum sp. SS-4]CAA7626217.1 cAMP-binding protein-catabolite gene activator and regulatory subunit of cAMP-dependent protein kinase [Magnetospirillum sp. SS-4]
MAVMDNSRRRVVFAAESVIFKEGEPGDTAYVVESGRVSIFKTVAGKTVSIGEVEAGGIFGEMALIDDHPRMASAKAVEETACVVIGKGRLFEQMDKAPKGVRVIVNALLGNIRAMGAELAEASVILSRDKDKE